MNKIYTILLFLIPLFSWSQTAKEWNQQAEEILETEPKKALELLEKASEDSKVTAVLKEKIKNNTAIAKRILGEYQEAIKLSDEVIQQTQSSEIKASSYTNLGAAYRRIGENEKAMKNYLKALELYEKEKKISQIATVENNIGLLYQSLDDFEKAISYHQRALKHTEQIKEEGGIAKSHNNLGVAFANEGNLEKSLFHFQKSYAIEKKRNNKIGISEGLNNIGGVLFYMGELDSALIYFKESLEFDRQNEDYANLVAGMNNLAEVYLNSSDFDNAKLYLDSANTLALQLKEKTTYLNNLESYSYFYELKGDLENALLYARKYQQAKDSIASLSNTQNIQELETKYQTEKKERLLLEKEIQLKSRTNTLIIISILLLSLIIIGFLIFRALRLKNQQQAQEFELKEAISKIETQQQLDNQRLIISRDLHDNIGAQLTFIISSIDTLKYAFKITDEKINSRLTTISNFTKDTITELRDTIWAMNHTSIDFEGIRTRISNFVEKAKAAQETITFDFQISENTPEISFTSVQGMNIYRIIQEAVNNSIKYAECNRIEIAVFSQNDRLYISVKDNGKGFDEEKVEGGNGLRNMRKRAREINADFIFISTEDKGTEVQLCLKTLD